MITYKLTIKKISVIEVNLRKQQKFTCSAISTTLLQHSQNLTRRKHRLTICVN